MLAFLTRTRLVMRNRPLIDMDPHTSRAHRSEIGERATSVRKKSRKQGKLETQIDRLRELEAQFTLNHSGG